MVLNTSLLHQWGYQLAEFDIPEYTIEERPERLGKIRRRLPRKVLQYSSNNYYEQDFEFNHNLITKGVFKNLHGYFQSWKYFADEFEDIRKVLKNSNYPRSNNYAELLAKFNTEEVIAVHVRRGDYIGLENYHGLMNYDYYQKALAIVTEKYPKSKIALFSDDIEIAKGIVNNPKYVIDSQVLTSPAETMLLMSSARSIVGANSSFSLWAGYLSDESNLNIYPENWFTDKEFEIDDLLLPRFERVRS